MTALSRVVLSVGSEARKMQFLLIRSCMSTNDTHRHTDTHTHTHRYMLSHSEKDRKYTIRMIKRKEKDRLWR